MHMDTNHATLNLGCALATWGCSGNKAISLPASACTPVPKGSPHPHAPPEPPATSGVAAR
eukprot:scaffold39140_cov22-Tisochrysis_lutea.AAC.3